MALPAGSVTAQSSFNGVAFPPEVVGPLVNRGLSGSPFFSALTRRDISAGSAVFPSVEPTGFDWVAELGVIPDTDMSDQGAVVAIAKLAGNVLVSNEAWTDGTFDLAGSIGDAMRDGMGARIDEGVLYGESGNTAAPTGLYSSLAVLSGPSLRAAAIAGAAEIMGSGGVPTTIFMPPNMWAAEMSRETTGGPVNNGTDLMIAGLRAVIVPTLKPTDAIVADTARCYAVVRSDARIEVNGQSETAWSRDGTQVRVIARVAAVIPSLGGAARALTVITPTPEPGG